MSTTPPRSLCDLPNELLKSVSSLLYDPEAESRDEINFCWDNSELWARDLGHLSRTCSKLRAVGVEILFHTVPARIIRLPAWQHFILPNHRQHIKAVMLAGVTQAELRALLPYLAVLSSLEHLHLGPLVIKSLEGEDSATTSSSPYLLPTAQYVAGEDGTVTALRTALRRVKSLGVSCIEGGAALASVLSVANNVETLQLRGGTKYGHFREGIPSVDCPVFVPLLSLKHVRCLHLDEKNSALFTSAVSVFPDSAWWPLVELCMVTALTHFELDLVALLASTLEKLSLERAADFTDDPSSAPLLTCPFPRLRQLEVDNLLCALLASPPHFTPHLTSLSIIATTDNTALSRFLSSPSFPYFLSRTALRCLSIEMPDVTFDPPSTTYLLHLGQAHGVKITSTLLFRPVGVNHARGMVQHPRRRYQGHAGPIRRGEGGRSAAAGDEDPCRCEQGEGSKGWRDSPAVGGAA